VISVHFTGATVVRFNGTNAAFTLDGASQITAVASPERPQGRITVTAALRTATSLGILP
jgi:hypothetical protein